MRFPDRPQPSPAQRKALAVLAMIDGPQTPWSWIFAWQTVVRYETLAVLYRRHWIRFPAGRITRRGRWIIGQPDPRDRDEWLELHPEKP